METERDETLEIIINDWPEKCDTLPEQLTPFFSYREELVVQEGLAKGNRVVIPQKLRSRRHEAETTFIALGH